MFHKGFKHTHTHKHISHLIKTNVWGKHASDTSLRSACDEEADEERPPRSAARAANGLPD